MTELTEMLNHKVYARAVGGNDTGFVKNHFDAIKYYVKGLKGFALFDNLNKETEDKIEGLKIKQWERNEIENYLPIPSTLKKYIASLELGPIFESQFEKRMIAATTPNALKNLEDDFWVKTKKATIISHPFLRVSGMKWVCQEIQWTNQSITYYAITSILTSCSQSLLTL